MTTYQAQLDKYRHLLIHNQGDQTQLTLQTSSPGQQQSQGSGFRTGLWTGPPTLFQVDREFVLRLDGRERQLFIEISAGGVHTLSGPPSLVGAQVWPMQPVEPPKMEPMQPMPPMRMQMGDMMMDMGSGQMSMGGSGGMQMGSGGMSMGNPAPAEPETASTDTAKVKAEAETPPAAANTEPPSTSPRPRFCSQCGTPVKPEDRFCAQCGHKLG